MSEKEIKGILCKREPIQETVVQNEEPEEDPESQNEEQNTDLANTVTDSAIIIYTYQNTVLADPDAKQVTVKASSSKDKDLKKVQDEEPIDTKVTEKAESAKRAKSESGSALAASFGIGNIVKQTVSRVTTIESYVQMKNLNVSSSSIRDANDMVVDSKQVRMQATLFAVVVEDALVELSILVQCNNSLRIMKTLIDIDALRRDKFDVEPEPSTHEESSKYDKRKLECLEYKIDKLDSDRKYFFAVMSSLYIELTIHHTFKSLLEYMEKTACLYAYRDFLKEDLVRNRQTNREIQRDMRLRRVKMRTAVYEINRVIDGLRSNIEDLDLWTDIKSRYVGFWQGARAEQNLLKINNEQVEVKNKIMANTSKYTQEQRVHSEVEMLTQICINETLQQVEYWMEKYDVDFEAINNRILLEKIKAEDMLEERLRLEKMVKKHAQEMEDWKAYKVEREKTLTYENKMKKSALIVQAWWRGILVRRRLGPFKRIKKKKEKKPKWALDY